MLRFDFFSIRITGFADIEVLHHFAVAEPDSVPKLGEDVTYHLHFGLKFKEKTRRNASLHQSVDLGPDTKFTHIAIPMGDNGYGIQYILAFI